MNTSAFYKLDDGDSTRLLCAPNFVYAPGFTLLAADPAHRVGIVDGWQWFDTEEAAYAHHGMALPIDPLAG